jgi:hypothetical protein
MSFDHLLLDLLEVALSSILVARGVAPVIYVVLLTALASPCP